MPLYDINCKTCGTQSEILIKGTEPKICPKCKSGDTEIVYTNPATPVFKGTGFYKTDYPRRK